MKLRVYHLVMVVGAWLFLSSTSAYCQTFAEYKEVGDNYLRSGKSALAIDEYKKALALNPRSTAVYFDLAIGYYKERNLQETISLLEKIVQLDPNDYEAYYNLGCFKLYGRNFKAASDYFKKAQVCCTANQDFACTIEQTLKFMDKLKDLDPQTQATILLFLATQSFLQ